MRYIAIISALLVTMGIFAQELSVTQHLEDFDFAVNEVEVSYAGFPTYVNDTTKTDHEGKPFQRPAAWDDAKLALQLGTAMQTRDEGGTPWNYSFCPQADYYMKSHLFGDIFACDQLTPAERELITVSALSAMDGVTPQFEGHKECAVFMGNTKEQVDYLCRWLEDNI